MMLTRIQEKLKALGCTVWALSENVTRGWEFYFIRRALDQNRVTEVRTVGVTLYRPLEDGFLGSASGELSPTVSDAELEKALADIYFQASLVKNPAYRLNDRPVVSPPPREIDPAAIAEDFISAMGQVKETETEDINSYEIFVRDVSRHFLNSNGVEYTVRYPSSMIEVVVNARRDGHEIELYRNFTSGSCDSEALKRDLSKAMAYGRDRLVTRPTPNLEKADVLFSGSDACSIYEYFVDRCNAAMIFRKLSDWTVGKPIAEDIRGDRVNVYARRMLPNSSRNRGFDAEGAPIRDTALLEQSVPKEILGGRMFASYMGLENSFSPTNIEVSGGTKTEEELRRGSYLEAVEFSDFQVDAMTGDIFGEIRLGYWHDGETVTPVSGGSISGSMADFIREMYLSVESVQYDNYRLPAVTKLCGVTVTGIAKQP